MILVKEVSKQFFDIAQLLIDNFTKFVVFLGCKVLLTAKNCKPGLKVYRGKNWERDWTDDHDDGHPGYGYVRKCLEFQWANVKWNGGVLERYRIGNSGKHDLCVSNRQVEEVGRGSIG